MCVLKREVQRDALWQMAHILHSSCESRPTAEKHTASRLINKQANNWHQLNIEMQRLFTGKNDWSYKLDIKLHYKTACYLILQIHLASINILLSFYVIILLRPLQILCILWHCTHIMHYFYEEAHVFIQYGQYCSYVIDPVLFEQIKNRWHIKARKKKKKKT